MNNSESILTIEYEDKISLSTDQIISKIISEYQENPVSSLSVFYKQNPYISQFRFGRYVKEKFSMSVGEYLCDLGIILPYENDNPTGISAEDELLGIETLLMSRYKDDPAESLMQIKEENPDISFGKINPLTRSVYNKTAKERLVDIGVIIPEEKLKKKDDRSTEEKLEEIKTILISRYGKRKKPTLLKDLFSENNDLNLNSVNSWTRELYDITAKEYYIQIGVMSDDTSTGRSSNSKEIPQITSEKTYLERGKCNGGIIGFTKKNIEDIEPISLQIMGRTVKCNNWTQLYVSFVNILLNQFPDVIQNLSGSSFLENFDTIDLCNQTKTHRMKEPVEIDKSYYVETSYPVPELIRRMRALLDCCGLDYNQCKIRYGHKKSEKKKQELDSPKEEIRIKPLRIKWDQNETVLLIDTYSRVKKQEVSRDEAIRFLSSVLRERAIAQGRTIDDGFRNQNGISMQLDNIRILIEKNSEITRHNSSVFISAVDLYKRDRNQFNLILERALRELFELGISYYSANDQSFIESKKDASETDFYNWLSQHELLAGPTCRAYVSGIRSSERYAYEHGYNPYRILASNKEEAAEVILNLLGDDTFSEAHAQYRSHLKKYLRYLGIEIEEKKGQSRDNNEQKKHNDMEETELSSQIEEMVKTFPNGISVEELEKCFGKYSKRLIHNAFKSADIMLVLGKYYHRDNIDDFAEMADILLEVLLRQFKTFGDYTSDVQLYKEARPRLDDFFFYNGAFDSKIEVYELAFYLFSKCNYKNNRFIFRDKRHIWKEVPKYSMDFGGLLVKYAREHGNVFSRDEAVDYFQFFGSGTPSQTLSLILYHSGWDNFLQFAENRFVLAEALNINDSFLSLLSNQIEMLLDGEDYVPLGDISDYFYSTLPNLPEGVSWGPLLLESVLERHDVGYFTIDAGEANDMKVIDAALVRKKSSYKSFSDIVWNELNNDYQLPVIMTKDDFRLYLLEKGFIHGAEKTYTVHKTVANDLRFFWSNGNSQVTISK